MNSSSNNKITRSLNPHTLSLRPVYEEVLFIGILDTIYNGEQLGNREPKIWG